MTCQRNPRACRKQLPELPCNTTLKMEIALASLSNIMSCSRLFRMEQVGTGWNNFQLVFFCFICFRGLKIINLSTGSTIISDDIFNVVYCQDEEPYYSVDVLARMQNLQERGCTTLAVNLIFVAYFLLVFCFTCLLFSYS